MKRLGVVLGILLLAGVAQAQQPYQCVPQDLIVNRLNNGAPIVVTSTAPVMVATESNARCQLTILNVGGGAMNCLSQGQGNPTTTAGLPLSSGNQIIMGPSGRKQWQCIAVSTDTTTVVLEEMP